MAKIWRNTYGIHKIEHLVVLSPFGTYMGMADGCRKCNAFGKGLTTDCPEHDSAVFVPGVASGEIDYIQGDWVEV